RTESPPTPPRIFTWVAVRKPVPAFHRLDADAVPDLDSATPPRPPQRRFRARKQFPIARNRHTDGMQVLLKTLNVLHRAKPQYRNRAHPRAPRLEKPAAATASNGIPMSPVITGTSSIAFSCSHHPS